MFINVKNLGFMACIILVSLVAIAVGLTIKQVLAILGVVLIVVTTVFHVKYRVAAALIALAIMLFSGILSVEIMIRYASFDVILFLIATMIFVSFLDRKGLFTFIAMKIISKARKPRDIILVITFLSAFLATTVGAVTAVLIMINIVAVFASLLDVDHLPLLIITVFSANIGSAATVIGNPVGVLIAFRIGYSFMDFLFWSAPATILALLVAYGLYLIQYRKYLRETLEPAFRKAISIPSYEIKPFDIILSAIFFIIVVALLISQREIEDLLRLKRQTALLAIMFGASAIALLFSGEKAIELVEQGVEWWTLLFFITFFASVGSLEYTGAIERFAIALEYLEEEYIFLTLPWIAGVMSAYLDNILAVSMLLSILEAFKSLGHDVSLLYWPILWASTYMGNLTPIGSSANLVLIGVMEKEGYEINFIEWMKHGLIVSIIPFITAFVTYWIRVMGGF